MTIIGMIAGSVITSIGIAAFVNSSGLLTEPIDDALVIGLKIIPIDDTFAIGDSETYTLNAPAHAKQRFDINGTSFSVTLVSPRGGLQIADENYKNELSLEWVHLEEGTSTLKIQNTGDSELHVLGSVQIILDPLVIISPLLVIITGLVILGFSAGFSIRKPKGF